MAVFTSKASLSPARRRLLEIFQQINFGRVQTLVIQSAEPLVDPPPRVVREVKLGGENWPRPELGKTDFLIKKEVVELFSYFDELQDGVIDLIEIKYGLPFRLTVTEVFA